MRAGRMPGSATASGVVQVLNVAPSITFMIIPSGDEGQSLQFRADIHDPGSDDLTVTWWGICHGGSGTAIFLNDPTINPDTDPSPSINPQDVQSSRTWSAGTTGSSPGTFRSRTTTAGRRLCPERLRADAEVPAADQREGARARHVPLRRSGPEDRREREYGLLAKEIGNEI
ncbi:MAG: hypothetical protein A3K68_06815 [Euryarchaeota archaeon RBG_16_68_13]|nr:MAG: hypothetical protein A3K68_06815 [Euryarchaeota archaeon RBG_16_68_13]